RNIAVEHHGAQYSVVVQKDNTAWYYPHCGGVVWNAVEGTFAMTRDARLAALHRGAFGLRGRAAWAATFRATIDAICSQARNVVNRCNLCALHARRAFGVGTTLQSDDPLAPVRTVRPSVIQLAPSTKRLL